MGEIGAASAVGIIVGVLVALVLSAALTLIVIRCLRRYKSKRLDRATALSEHYVKLWQAKTTSRQRKNGVGSAEDQLCAGVMKTYDAHAQVGVESYLSEYEVGHAPHTEEDSRSVHSYPTKPKRLFRRSGTIEKFLSQRQSSQDSLPSTRRPAFRKLWNSMSSVLPANAKREHSKQSLPSPGKRQRTISTDTVEEDTSQPYILLAVEQKPGTSSLCITILGFTDFTEYSDTENVLVRALLQPKNVTLPAIYSLTENRMVELNFSGMKLEDLLINHLSLHIFDLNDKALGEVFINLAPLRLEPENVVKLHEKIFTTSCNRKTSTSRKLLSRDLGQLFLMLHHHSDSLDVLIYRASKLPKSDSRLSLPSEYQVRLELKGEDCSIRQTVSTSYEASDNPTWNEQFSFSLKKDDLATSSIEATCFERRKLSSSHQIIGRVTLGHNSTETAASQWRDCTKPFLMGVSRWHQLLPVVSYAWH